MDMHLLNGLDFEFDNENEIDIQAILRCLDSDNEDPLFDDASLYCYEDHFEDPE